MDKFEAKNVINGTFGEMWIDGDYFAEAVGLSAKIKLNTTAVKQSRKLQEGQKVTGVTMDGTVKLNKVSSTMLVKIAKAIKEGKGYRATIISNLEDPDALGAERIKLTGCLFTEVDLINWENGNLGEESIPFTFEDFELIDTIGGK